MATSEWQVLLAERPDWSRVFEAAGSDGAQTVLYAIDESQMNGHTYVGCDHMFIGACRASDAVEADLARFVRDPLRVFDILMWKSSGKVRKPPEHFALVRRLRQVDHETVQERVIEGLKTNIPTITPALEGALWRAKRAGHKSLTPIQVASLSYVSTSLIANALERENVSPEAAVFYHRIAGEWGGLIAIVRETDEQRT